MDVIVLKDVMGVQTCVDFENTRIRKHKSYMFKVFLFIAAVP